mgnify:CR=1 FL=1|jgi:dCMP deaminase
MLKDNNFLKIAEEVAKASKCVSKQVGCVIVKDNRIISTGYNGTPKGYINCNEKFDSWSEEHHEWSKKNEIHAEMNALIWSARNGVSIDKSVLYCTLEPCSECTKNIIASGVTKIVYSTKYEHANSEELKQFIKQNNIEYVFKPLKN